MTYIQTDALPTAATYSHLTTLKAEASRTADALRTLACVATDGPLSDAADDAAARCEAIHPALDSAAASLAAAALPDPVSPPVPDRFALMWAHAAWRWSRATCALPVPGCRHPSRPPFCASMPTAPPTPARRWRPCAPPSPDPDPLTETQ